MFLGSTINTFGNNDLKSEIEKDYKIKSEQNTRYGKAYIITDKNKIGEERFIWDLIDFVMAGWSWADFFRNPNLKNLKYAVIDTASLLPFVPSTRPLRTANDALNAANDIKKLKGGENFLKRITKVATKGDQSISAKAYEELYDFFGKDKRLADEVYNQFLGALGKRARKNSDIGSKKLEGKSVSIQGLKEDKSFGTIIYDFELKILGGKGKNYRFFGKYNSKGELIFEKFGKALH